MTDVRSTNPGPWQRVSASFVASPRRTLVLVALIPVMVIVWWPLIRGKKASPTPAAPAPAAPAVATPSILPPAPMGETKAPSAPVDSETLDIDALCERARVKFMPRWQAIPSNDPFAPRPGSASGTAQKPAGPEHLIPSSVFLSATRAPIAVIRGRAYRTGDEVEGHVIVEIKERRVVLKRGDKVFAVSIPRPKLGRDHD